MSSKFVTNGSQDKNGLGVDGALKSKYENKVGRKHKEEQKNKCCKTIMKEKRDSKLFQPSERITINLHL